MYRAELRDETEAPETIPEFEVMTQHLYEKKYHYCISKNI
jgi:hypothetical protein